jgi:sec-independent protein translocase protein TatB
MFDIAFSELMIIGVVALVVIEPERLPKVARTLGHLFGRMQRYVTQVKSDISREMELAELGKMKSEFESAARSFQGEVESQAAKAEREIRETQEQIDRELGVDPPAAAGPAEPDASGPGIPPPGSPQMELGIDEAPTPPAPDKANG